MSLLKSDLQKSAGLLKENAPDNHLLAYITPNEREMLIAAGGKETATTSGVKAYPGHFGISGESMGVKQGPKQDTSSSGGNNEPTRYNPHTDSGTSIATPSRAERGDIDAEEEYLAPDKDHYIATQKAIKSGIKDLGDDYKADYNDWEPKEQKAYQTEMNKLKGTKDVNYSFYKGNEGTTNLTFAEHWKDAVITDPLLKLSPTARLLVAGARTLKENLTTDYGTWKYGAAGTDGSGRAVDRGGWLGRIFNSDGTTKNISEDEAQSILNDHGTEIYQEAPSVISGVNIGGSNESPAAKWYKSLGKGTNNQFNFSFQTEYNNAKAKQASILGAPTRMKYLALNQSPFFDFLKKNKLDRGIL